MTSQLPCRTDATDVGESGEDGFIDLQQLVERCLGNLALVDKLISSFSGRLEHSMEELLQTVGGQDLPAVALHAHRLKGESSNLCATRIYRVASDLEQAARRGRQGEAESLLGHLDAACRQFRENVVSFEQLSNSGRAMQDSETRSPCLDRIFRRTSSTARFLS